MPDVLTVADARYAMLGSAAPTGDLADDGLVQVYVDAVNQVIEDLSQPAATVDRTVVRDGGGISVTTPWPFSAVVSVTENGQTLSSANYDFDGDAGIVYRGKPPVYYPFYPGMRTITVVVSTGVSVLPGSQKLAGWELFRHLWQTRQGRPGSFAQPNGVDVVITSSGYAVPNRVMELLASVPRFPGFA